MQVQRLIVVVFSSFYKKELNCNFAAVLYGCETWSLTLRVERRLRVFDTRELRRIFGPTRYKLTAEWIRLNYEELNDVYCSQNIIRMFNQEE